MSERFSAASQGGDASAAAQSPAYFAASTEQLERLTHVFECSARRWELVVYPSLFAFIILAAYGFYLVYSLANDVAYMSESIDRNMTQLVSNFEIVSRDMDRITMSVDDMSTGVGDISDRVSLLNVMSEDMHRMQVSVRDMSHAARYMQGDLRLINYSFGRPMAAMSSPITFGRTFLPF